MLLRVAAATSIRFIFGRAKQHPFQFITPDSSFEKSLSRHGFTAALKILSIQQFPWSAILG
jgi:hypothetical protein